MSQTESRHSGGRPDAGTYSDGQDSTAPTTDRARRTLLATIRHDLRTPINAIVGYSEMLLEDLEGTDEQGTAPDLRKIRSAGTELLALVSSILDPARINASQELDLKAVGIELRRDLRTPINAVLGYSEMLLEDADGAGQDTVTADLRKIHSAAEHFLSLIDDVVRFSGKDAADAVLDAEGTLAPAVLRDVVSTVRSLEEGNEMARDEPGHILIVDDKEINRDILSRHLERRGHMTTGAENGVRALELVGATRFDLVLLDIRMPQMNGYEVLRRLKSDPSLRDIPVIVISALDEMESVVRCIEMGAEDYLPKPFNPVLLQARIGASLEKKRLRDQEQLYLEQIRFERAKSERLLLNVLPEAIAARLKEGEHVIAERYEEVTVLFADIVGFTEYSASTSPEKLVYLLNDIFSSFDRLADRHGVEKIKTIGDAYMAVGGVPTPRHDHAPAIAEMALDMQEEIARVKSDGIAPLDIRVGINAGPVIAGIIGTRKFIYDLWGDTVNTASRMESHGLVGRIQVTAHTYERLKHAYRFEERGVILVKGKGEMTTYVLAGRL